MGAGTGAALQRIREMTPEIANSIDPVKVRAALTFYQNAVENGEGGWTAPLRIALMQKILDLQGKGD